MSDVASEQERCDKRRCGDRRIDRSECSAGTSPLPFHLPARLSLSFSVRALKRKKKPFFGIIFSINSTFSLQLPAARADL